ncbi:hypothetical protein [Streptomyces sp. NPDC088707]|uniref:hypothetical protein n=1 Tax=Streptomyces sp. NPDC088707 TaxID=3365871 RepID=UPI00380B883B
MTTNTRSPERIERARDRAAARETLLVLLGRVDRLSPAEAALLREYTLVVLTEADEQAHSRRGLDRARDRLQRSLTAAERAIVEVEAERDQAREQLAQAEHRIGILDAVDLGRAHGAARVMTERDAARDSERHARAEARETRGLLNAALVRAKQAEAKLDAWAREADDLVLAHRQRADRHHTAWRSARRRADKAKATLAAIRTPQPVGSDHPMYALLDAMVGPRIGQYEARELVGEYFRAITQQEPTP